MPDSRWWRNEARLCAEDGHPGAAMTALANAGASGQELERYAAAIGYPWPPPGRRATSS